MKKKYSIPTSTPRFAHLAEKPVAFFSAEYALDDQFPMYAGGLGVLAGDFLLEASQEGLPMIAVGLFYRRGFETFISQPENAVNVAMPEPFASGYDPRAAGFTLVQREDKSPMLLEIELGERIILVQVWRRIYGTVHLFLLDADTGENSPDDRMLTAFLYPRDFRTKLLQEVIFGVGAVKLFRQLNIWPSCYHLNEAHTAFVVLALIIEYLHDHPEVQGFMSALSRVRLQIVATKHTILSGAGLFFSRTDFQGVLDVYLARHNLSFEDFYSIGSWEKEPQIFSMTRFLLKSAIRANAVSKLHAAFELQAHPKSQLFPITNAVNLKRWQGADFFGQDLSEISDQQLWRIHSANRQALIERVRNKTGADLDPQALTVVWARRLAGYKRPTLLFSDPKRLLRIVSRTDRPVQFIISGQSNVADQEGTAFLKKILQYTQNGNFAGRVVWLPNYDLSLARTLVLGADLWLNTPTRGREASGTSGMKSAINGGLQFSTLDGWVDEMDWFSRGWILPEMDIQNAIYAKLETEIIPLFYERDGGLPRKWLKMMRNAMIFIQKEYSTKRMLEEYIRELYFPDA